MKEIIEYILAGLIILLMIPYFNAFITTYYRIDVKQQLSDLSSSVAWLVRAMLTDVYSKGNFTSNLTDFDELLGHYLPPNVKSMYMYRVSLNSGIASLQVDRDVIKAVSMENGTMHVLLVLSNGTWLYGFTKNVVLDELTGLFTYIINASAFKLPVFSNIVAIVAVQESVVTRYVKYWFNTSRIGFPLNINGSLVVALNIDGAIPNVLNTTIIYYSGGGFNSYSNTTYDFNRLVIFSGTTYNTTVEKIFINYVARRLNVSSEYQYFVVRLNTSSIIYNVTARNCDINYTKCGVFSSTTPRPGNTSEITIDPKLYNAVLIILRDISGNIYIVPTYRDSLLFGQEPAIAVNVFTHYSYIRIGLFDYYMSVEVWPR
ncbi:MAG: hypothetical protein QXU13_01800 [Desulfurococcaceae archaeon]